MQPMEITKLLSKNLKKWFSFGTAFENQIIQGIQNLPIQQSDNFPPFQNYTYLVFGSPL